MSSWSSARRSIPLLLFLAGGDFSLWPVVILQALMTAF